jgi:glycosyltransferase involved in cell wall biosynthesis
VANSLASAAAIRDWLPPGLLEIVFNGIDISRFRPRQRPAAADRLVVGMVGNLTSRSKKHGLLIEAAALVNPALPIEWRIYGHDPSAGGTQPADAYIDQLHAQIARAGLGQRFRFPGHVGNPAEIMEQIDVLVHPADNESFGRVIVEAMAAGLPTVGVRGGGVGEIIQHEQTGLLAGCDDPRDLAASIERLACSESLRAQYGQAGRRRAEEHYSLAATTAGMLRVYEQSMALRLGAVPRPAPSVALHTS